MKVEVKKVDAVKRELKFEIPKERVSKKMSEVYEDLGKAAKVKGFRPGKVPRHILEARHGKLAQEEALKDLIPEVYQEGIVQENLSPIDLPEILDVHFKEGMVTFTARLDIKPEVKVGDYKGIKVTRKSSAVTNEDIEKTLEVFKKSQGEGKEVAVDDAFARGLGFPSLEEFKKSLSRQMEMEKDRQNRLDVENQVVEHLLKKAKLTTPLSLVEKQLQRRLQEIEQRLKTQGLAPDAIQKKCEEIRADLKTSVEKDVKVYLILDKIGQMENIAVREEENLAAKVMEFLLREAKWEEPESQGGDVK